MKEQKGRESQELISTLTEVIIKYLTLTGDLLHATDCANIFTVVISFNSHNNLGATGTIIILRNYYAQET